VADLFRAGATCAPTVSAFFACFAVQIRCSASVLDPQLVADRQWLLVLRPQGSSVRSPQSKIVNQSEMAG